MSHTEASVGLEVRMRASAAPLKLVAVVDTVRIVVAVPLALCRVGPGTLPGKRS